MPLTHNQKSNLGFLTFVCVLLCFFTGVGLLVAWCDSTSSVQRFCSGTTGIIITHTHGDGDSTAVKYDDPKCK